MGTFKFLQKTTERNWDLYERKVLNLCRYFYSHGLTNVIGQVYDFYDDHNRVIRINDINNNNIAGVYHINYSTTIYHTHTSHYLLRIENDDFENIMMQDEDL